MNHQSIISSVLFAAALALPVLASAGSSTASLAAEGASSAAGSASNSLGTSSNSSSKGTGVANGDYKIIDVAIKADKPNMVAIKLQATDSKNTTPEFELVMPALAFEKSGLKTGEVVAASEQNYGVKFANAKTQAAFFLVMHDDIYRELTSNPVSL
jgi:hypothetical protein